MLLGSENEIRVNIKVDTITEFFKYRQGPQLEIHAWTIELDSKSHDKLCDAFATSDKYNMDNHISWIQEDGLLYIHSDGRLYVGIARPNTKMFAQ